MAILIDPAVWPAHGTVWSHLVSDTSYEELHAFARAQGIPRRAFDLDHYDVPLERHDELVAAGAVAVASRELLRRIQVAGLRVRQIDRALVEDARRDEFLVAEWRRLGASALGGRSRVGAGPATLPRRAGADAGDALGAKTLAAGAVVGSPASAAPDPGRLPGDRTAPPLGDRDGWARLGAALLGRWGEPHRAYHGVRHLEDVLLGLDQLRTWGEPVSPAAFLAAWFHDAVYAGSPGDDERASAELARVSLREAGASGGLADRVARLVLATIPGPRRAVGEPGPAPTTPAGGPSGHALPAVSDGSSAAAGTFSAGSLGGGAARAAGDLRAADEERADEDALLDADLAILAAGASRYAWYTAAVRLEYAHVPDEAFRAGRAAVLEGILASERIYVTAAAHARWELRARANLAAEIAALRA